uniref:Uncharacterized protein n=1 Tax=Sphaerodactylus townsendi TaxID=933632 RepID=A0ACB8EQN7_9SAUR
MSDSLSSTPLSIGTQRNAETGRDCCLQRKTVKIPANAPRTERAVQKSFRRERPQSLQQVKRARRTAPSQLSLCAKKKVRAKWQLAVEVRTTTAHCTLVSRVRALLCSYHNKRRERSPQRVYRRAGIDHLGKEDAGTSTPYGDEAIEGVNRMLKAASFAADATLDSVTFSARSMASLVATRRLLLLRAWQMDWRSKSLVLECAFQCEKLFGEDLKEFLVDPKEKPKHLPKPFRGFDRKPSSNSNFLPQQGPNQFKRDNFRRSYWNQG